MKEYLEDEVCRSIRTREDKKIRKKNGDKTRIINKKW